MPESQLCSTLVLPATVAVITRPVQKSGVPEKDLIGFQNDCFLSSIIFLKLPSPSFSLKEGMKVSAQVLKKTFHTACGLDPMGASRLSFYSSPEKVHQDVLENLHDVDLSSCG